MKNSLIILKLQNLDWILIKSGEIENRTNIRIEDLGLDMEIKIERGNFANTVLTLSKFSLNRYLWIYEVAKRYASIAIHYGGKHIK